MATKKKPTARKWAGTNAKPSRMKAERPAAKKKAPEPPAIPDTREDLLEKIGAVLREVDAFMVRDDWRSAVEFTRWDSSLREPKRAIEDLIARLDKILGQDDPAAIDLINEMFGTTPGTVPSWARPGTFLLWIGYIPCRCIWGGFADPTADIVAADPTEKWFAPSGAVNMNISIPPSCRTVDALFRTFLTSKTEERAFKYPKSRAYNAPAPKDLGPMFNLHRLAEMGREAAEKELAKPSNAWLAPALKRGPVNPIPLPAHLQFVQMSWVG
jgi:hypothetical protein